MTSKDKTLICFIHTLYVQLKSLQTHIMRIAKEEPYMGEKIPLRWLKFEEAKGTAKEEVMNMDKVLYNYF